MTDRALAKQTNQGYTAAVAMIDGAPAIVNIGPDGALKRIQQKVQLDHSLNEYEEIPPKSGKFQISAIGYRRLNQVASTSFVAPDTILDEDGKTRPNPYAVRNEDGNPMRAVNVQTGIGHSATGELICVTHTQMFDLQHYLTEILMNRWGGRSWWDKSKNARVSSPPADWGALKARHGKSEPKRPEHANDAWQWFPVMDGFALWVDGMNPAVHEIIKDHNHRCKFLFQLVQAFCQRTIMKKIIGIERVEQNGVVTVYGWRTAYQDIGQLRAAIEAAKRGQGGRHEATMSDGHEFDGDMIDAELANERTDNQHDQPPDAEPAPNSPPDRTCKNSLQVAGSSSSRADAKAPGVDPKLLGPLKAHVRALYGKLAPATADRALADAGAESMAEIASTGEVELLRGVIESLKAAQK